MGRSAAVGGAKSSASVLLFSPFEMDAEYFAWSGLDECFSDYSMCVTTGDDTERVFMTQTELVEQNPGAENIREYVYRPFDVRWIDHSAQLERPREIMEHFYQPNLGILALGPTRRRGPYDYSFVTTRIADKNCLSQEANCSVFPLYRYLTPEAQVPLPGGLQPNRLPNARDELLAHLAAEYGNPVTPEAAFYYIHAVLNASGYLEAYEDQLRVEYPHIPFPKAAGHFETFSQLGRVLANAQSGANLAHVQFAFNTTGNSMIGDVLYLPEQQSVQINDSGTVFTGITAAIWNYHVGTNQPLRDWLQSRHGRTFVLDYSNPPAEGNVPAEVLIDDFRDIARRIATALPVHEQIDAAWEQVVATEWVFRLPEPCRP